VSERASEEDVSFCEMEERQEQGKSSFQAALSCHPGHFHISQNFNFPSSSSSSSSFSSFSSPEL